VIDGPPVRADDVHMIVEYAGLVSAFALLAATLSGSYGQNVAAVFASSGAGISTVAKAARAQHVSPSGAKAAYKRAPYPKPALKYLYALGWIGGMRNRGQCALTSITQNTARKYAEQDIRGNAKLTAQLRKRAVSVSTAASTLVKGVVSACP
jgi:hypothetical protein